MKLTDKELEVLMTLTFEASQENPDTGYGRKMLDLHDKIAKEINDRG